MQEETLTDEEPKQFLTLFHLSFSVRTLWQQRVNVLKKKISSVQVSFSAIGTLRAIGHHLCFFVSQTATTETRTGRRRVISVT